MNLVLQYILKRTVSSFLVFLHHVCLVFPLSTALSLLQGFFYPINFLNQCQMCYPDLQKPCGQGEAPCPDIGMELAGLCPTLPCSSRRHREAPPALCPAEPLALHWVFIKAAWRHWHKQGAFSWHCHPESSQVPLSVLLGCLKMKLD